jgi:hypothetical protein
MKRPAGASPNVPADLTQAKGVHMAQADDEPTITLHREWSTPTLTPYTGTQQTAEAVLVGESTTLAEMPRKYREVFDDIKLPTGRPREFDHVAIRAAAEDVAKTIPKRGIFPRVKQFFEKVYDLLIERNIKAPDPEDSTMKRIAGEVYKRHWLRRK